MKNLLACLLARVRPQYSCIATGLGSRLTALAMHPISRRHPAPASASPQLRLPADCLVHLFSTPVSNHIVAHSTPPSTTCAAGFHPMPPSALPRHPHSCLSLNAQCTPLSNHTVTHCAPLSTILAPYIPPHAIPHRPASAPPQLPFPDCCSVPLSALTPLHIPRHPSQRSHCIPPHATLMPLSALSCHPHDFLVGALVHLPRESHQCAVQATHHSTCAASTHPASCLSTPTAASPHCAVRILSCHTAACTSHISPLHAPTLRQPTQPSAPFLQSVDIRSVA
jgi:hypothetical protein